jgi:hypothetical protein
MSPISKLFYCGLLLASLAFGQQTTTYAFSVPTTQPGTYAPLSGGTILAEGGTIDDAMWYGLEIGFDFPFGGSSSDAAWFSALAVSSNGWLKLGGIPATANEQSIYSVASSATQTQVLMPFARNLEASDATAEIRIETSGASPNRVCVVQWKNFQQKATLPKMRANFQARLYESGVIEFVYGDWTFTSSFNGTTGSVGIKGRVGSGLSDYRICSSTVSADSWTFPATNAASVQSSHYVGATAGKYPENGLIYRFTPTGVPSSTLRVDADLQPRFVAVGGTAVLTATPSLVGGGLLGAPVTATWNASPFGGSATTPMNDDGTNGDAIAGDGVYSAVVVPTTTGSTGTWSIDVTMSDGIRTASTRASLSEIVVPNDFPEAALPITLGTNGPFSNASTLTAATPFKWNARISSASANPGCTYEDSYGVHDVWYQWTAPCGGTLWASTFSNEEGAGIALPTGFMSDTVLSVWSAEGVSLACGDDTGAEAPPVAGIGQSAGFGVVNFRQSVVSLTVIGGRTYLFRVAASGTTSGAPGQFFLRTRLISGTASTLGLSCGSTPNATFAATPPILGSVASIALTGSDAYAFGLLLMSTPTPVITPWQGCSLYLNAFDILLYLPFNTDGVGAWSYSTPVPNDPALECAALTLQCVTSGTSGFGVTNAVNVTIGN